MARAFLLAGLAQAGGRLVVVTTATTADAEALAADVAAFCGPDSAAVFPAWETLPHERLSPRSETVAARLRLLHRLGDGEDGLRLLAVPARAMMQPLAPGWTPSTRCGWPGATGSTWRSCWSGWSPPATGAPTWSSAGARSPSAAAWSTSSRRARTTRSGSSCGATRSRASAPSPCPASAP